MCCPRSRAFPPWTHAESPLGPKPKVGLITGTWATLVHRLSVIHEFSSNLFGGKQALSDTPGCFSHLRPDWFSFQISEAQSSNARHSKLGTLVLEKSLEPPAHPPSKQNERKQPHSEASAPLRADLGRAAKLEALSPRSRENHQGHTERSDVQIMSHV